MVSRAEFTLGQLAEALGATLEGDPARVVRGVAPLESAGPDDVSFLTDARYRAAAQASRAGAFVAGAGVTGLPASILTVAAPQQAMIDLLLLFHPAPPLLPGVHPSAVVAADARVDATAAVGPLAVIEAGARIGSGARVGALTYVGHNVEVGEHSILVAQVGVSGSSKLGRGVVLAGQVGIADHVSVGDGAMVAAQGGVPSDLAAGGRYLGTPARPAMEARRIVAAESRPPQLLQRVPAPERAVEGLRGRPGSGEHTAE